MITKEEKKLLEKMSFEEIREWVANNPRFRGLDVVVSKASKTKKSKLKNIKEWINKNFTIKCEGVIINNSIKFVYEIKMFNLYFYTKLWRFYKRSIAFKPKAYLTYDYFINECKGNFYLMPCFPEKWESIYDKTKLLDVKEAFEEYIKYKNNR
jgi:hypothetical protein